MMIIINFYQKQILVPLLIKRNQQLSSLISKIILKQRKIRIQSLRLCSTYQRNNKINIFIIQKMKLINSTMRS